MTWRLATLVGHDLSLQFRYGLYAAYSFVVALYAALFIWGGAILPAWLPAVIIFTDPAALGFFFLGGLIMLERSEGVRAALAVAPIAPADYYWAKTLTLTAVALVACIVLLLVSDEATSPALVLGAVALISVQYIGIGVPIALRFRTVSGYLIGSAGFLTPVIAPGFLALLDPMPLWLAVIPAVSQLRLLLAGTGAVSATATEIALMLVVSGAAAALASWLGIASLRREFGR